MDKAETYFSPVPIFTVNLFEGEVLGYDRLKALAEQVYGERNPTERFFKEQPYKLTKKAGEYILRMTLPFVSKDNVEINKISDELIIRIGSFKRHMLLPRQVAASKSARAKLEGHDLYVYFQGENHGKEKKRERA